jgi:hypothetical protein
LGQSIELVPISGHYSTEKFCEDHNEYVGALASMRKEKMKNRIGEDLEKLRLDHLNSEEKAMMNTIFRGYHGVFYFPGYKLNSTNPIKYSISMIPGHESHKYKTV